MEKRQSRMDFVRDPSVFPVSNTAPSHCSMQNSLQQASPLHTESSYVTFPGAVLGPNT